MVGPVALGQSMFVLQANAPDLTKIPPADLLGITAILISCHYRNQEFIRVGYYLKNEYTDPEMQVNPPEVCFSFSISESFIIYGFLHLDTYS